MSEQIIIHTDGASRGNPGPAAFAYTIHRPGSPDIEEAGLLGQMTNNQAEYTAFVRALERAAMLGLEGPVLLKSDSELIVKQMRGEYRVKNEELRPLYEQARRAATSLKGGVTFEHVRRDQNKRTDELCNLALDGGNPARRGDTRHQHLTTGGKTLIGVREGNAVKADAISILSEAGALPTAEAVWDEMAKMLRRHGYAIPK